MWKVDGANALRSYIKELAERINSIESKLESDAGLSQDDIDRLFASPERSRIPGNQGPMDDLIRKRPFAHISGGDGPIPNSRHAAWTTELRTLQGAQGGTEAQDPYYPLSLAPQPNAPRVDDALLRSRPEGEVAIDDSDDGFELDEGVLHE